MKTVAEYSENNILVIPQSLFSMTDVVPLLHDGNSAIFYKNLEHDLVDVEFYTNTPCIIYIENGQETITTSENKIKKNYYKPVVDTTWTRICLVC